MQILQSITYAQQGKGRDQAGAAVATSTPVWQCLCRLNKNLLFAATQRSFAQFYASFWKVIITERLCKVKGGSISKMAEIVRDRKVTRLHDCVVLKCKSWTSDNYTYTFFSLWYFDFFSCYLNFHISVCVSTLIFLRCFSIFQFFRPFFAFNILQLWSTKYLWSTISETGLPDISHTQQRNQIKRGTADCRFLCSCNGELQPISTQ